MKLVLQRTQGDCGIAALATWLEQAYEDVYVAVSAVDRTSRGRAGLTTRALMRAAARLGVPLVRREADAVNLQEDEGILGVKWARGKRVKGYGWHFVLLYNGTIADPADGVILEADEYMARERARVWDLLTERQEG